MDINSDGKTVGIVYFSGTGGTTRAVDCLERSLIARGCLVQKNSLEISGSEAEDRNQADTAYDILMVVYPVHAFDAPEVIYDWIERLPGGKGIPAAVISVSGGGEVWPNTASRAGCIKALERKGFNVIYERMLIMPSNIFIDTHDHLAIHLLKCLPIKAEHCASEILFGIRRRKRVPATARIVSAICKLEKPGARLFGRGLSATGACSSCGWCQLNCPRHNISMRDGRPNFGGKCIACLRCFYGCPRSAIRARLFGFAAVKKGYDLNKLEQRMDGVELESAEKLAKGVFASLLGYIRNVEL